MFGLQNEAQSGLQKEADEAPADVAKLVARSNRFAGIQAEA
eukprot:CAMPEP_0119520082 /NCGR_PEP_ID=MMETSP1344-20130328/36193_1 /TAXON_ID=236787 /ORGANISM="Florenciella parvula, Strain CCMP2471" /LENGTH=40 /DNA_ID= /DNA_START= /DNA_END= /DNA_ORIENTATION=